MCYGMTGTGKTHTMFGGSSQGSGASMAAAAAASLADGTPGPGAGIVPRTLHELFSAAEMARSRGWAVTARMTLVQIYCELVHDLLGGAGAVGGAREDASAAVSGSLSSAVPGRP